MLNSPLNRLICQKNIVLAAMPILGIFMLFLLTACTRGEEGSQAELERLTKHTALLTQKLATLNKNEIESEVMKIRLAFNADADLDLYVTDPRLETIYFANHESKSGGRIESDIRCDFTGDRVESINFLRPAPGLYRVGVDYPLSCGPESKAAAFAVSVTGAGVEVRAAGHLEQTRFKPIVLEFEVTE